MLLYYHCSTCYWLSCYRRLNLVCCYIHVLMVLRAPLLAMCPVVPLHITGLSVILLSSMVMIFITAVAHHVVVFVVVTIFVCRFIYYDC